MRTHAIYVTGRLHQALRTAAEMHDVKHPEDIAEKWLSEKLETLPEVADRAKRRSDALEKADAEWRAYWQEKGEEF